MQLELFDHSELRASDGTYCTEREKRIENNAKNKYIGTINHLLSVTSFMPTRLRQLSEENELLKELLRKNGITIVF